MWKDSFEAIVKEFKGNILPPNHPIVRRVRRVAQRILEANDLGTLRSVEYPRGRLQTRDVVFGSEMYEGEVFGGEKYGGGGTKAGVRTPLSEKVWNLIVVDDMKMVNAMATPGMCQSISFLLFRLTVDG
jgi:metalloendopeptidase OMA1, mitochondrial